MSDNIINFATAAASRERAADQAAAAGRPMLLFRIDYQHEWAFWGNAFVWAYDEADAHDRLFAIKATGRVVADSECPA